MKIYAPGRISPPSGQKFEDVAGEGRKEDLEYWVTDLDVVILKEERGSRGWVGYSSLS